MSPRQAKPEPPAPKRLTVILKASDACNGACTFCAVGPAGRNRMRWEHFERFADRLEELAGQQPLEELTLTFHGGEPTLLGPRWLTRACERMQALPVPVRFNLQSNLLTFSDALLRVVRRFEIRVGSSVDPVCGLRQSRPGEDAFPRWLENYKRLTDHGLQIGAIFVVTRPALGQWRRLYQIAEGLGGASGRRFGLQVNPVYAQGRAARDSRLQLTPKQFGTVLVRLYRHWERRGRSVHLVPIENFALKLLPEPNRHASLQCSFAGDCSQSHLGVDYDLRVAGCGRRLDSGAFLGDLHRSSFAELLGSDEKRAVARRRKTLQKGACRDCRHFALCHGGCPDDAWLATGNLLDRFHWCDSWRALWDAMESGTTKPRKVYVMPPRADPPGTPRVSVQLGRDPAFEGAPTRRRGPLERWLLPTTDGRPLRFDSGLERALRGRVNLLRLWVPNRQVRALHLWDDVVRTAQTRVVLYESEGLAEAATLLNTLRASMILDVHGLQSQPQGLAQVQDVLDRFLGDPGWRASVFPFAQMLIHGLRHHLAPATNRWGLRPGAFHPVDVSPDNGSAAAKEVAEALARDAEMDASRWLVARRYCLECPLFRLCGAQLSSDDGRPCAPALRKMVEQVGETADQLSKTLQAG
ncbi:MAG: SPASM domain-containing protein [bacterium]